MMKDLTEGNPQSLLWRFTIPMFISVIFQRLIQHCGIVNLHRRLCGFPSVRSFIIIYYPHIP